MNVKYEKGIYEAKINQLRGYHNTLGTHLSNLEGYKSQIPNFWDDPRAQKVSTILTEQIRDVKTTMSQTNLEIISLQNVVDKLGAVEVKEDQELETTFRALEAASKFIPK